MFSSSAWLGLVLSAAPEVDLSRALELARATNAELRVARSEVDVASASVPLAHDWQMPELRVMFNDIQNVPTGQFRWFAGLSWRPPNPWEWSHGTDAAKARLVQAEFERAALEWKVTRDLRLAWLDVSGAAAHEAIAGEAVEVRRKLLHLLKRRVEGGQSTQIELNLAQLGETDARQEQVRWQSAGLKAEQAVAYLVGQPLKPVPVSLPAEPPQLPEPTALDGRLERHPQLEALVAKVAASEANVKNQQAQRYPWPELQVRLRQTFTPGASHDLQVGLTVPLAVTPAPRVEVARALAVRNHHQLDAERAQLRSQLHTLLARAAGLLTRWQGFEADYRAALSSHRQLQQRVLGDGTLDPTLLLAADRQAIELEHQRLEVKLDLARTLVEIDWVAGPVLLAK